LNKWKGDILFLVLVGAMVAGWLSLYPQPGESPLAPLDAPSGLAAESLLTYAGADGTRLAYRRYEPQGTSGHIVVLLHDTLLHSGWYEHLGQDLAQRGVAVYIPDRRGWGHSEGDRRKVFEDKSVLLTDITAMIAVAQARSPQTDVYLAGDGRAAGLVLQYAATQRPLAGVILLSPYLSDDQPNLRPEGWKRFASAHPGEAFLARAGLAHWPVWHYNWPQTMVDADPLLETRCALDCQQETWLMPDARGGADTDTAELGTQTSPLPASIVLIGNSALVDTGPGQTAPDGQDPNDAVRSDSTVDDTPIDLGALYGKLEVPLLCVQALDGPLFDPAQTAQMLTSLAPADHRLDTYPGVDHLTLLEVAVVPIFDWLSSR